MDSGDSDGSDVERWLRIYPCLRRCGRIAIARRRDRAVEDDLRTLSVDPAFGRHRSSEPDDAEGLALLKRVTDGVLQPCRDELCTPVASGRYADQAILCWWCHVVNGVGTKSVYHSLRSGEKPLLEGAWANPAKTARERMWATDHPEPRRVTQGALPGLLRIADAWSGEFDLSSQQTDLPVIDPTTPSATHDDALLIGDLGAPNGTRRRPSQRLTKGWRIRNTGATPWADRYLTRHGAASGPGLPRTARRTRVPTTQPGRIAQVTVAITAPAQPGSYEIHWEMTDQYGNPCFPDRHDLDFVFAFHVV